MEVFGYNIENIEVALKHYIIPGRDWIYRLHLEKDILLSREHLGNVRRHSEIVC